MQPMSPGPRCAWLRGKCLDLTRGEFRLLRLLMLNPDRTISHEAILEQMARQGARPSTNAVEVQVARLRRKLDEGQIRTIRGIGYRFLGIENACGGTEIGRAHV